MSPRAENEKLARGERQRALAPDVRLFDGPPGEECAWDADYAQYYLLLEREGGVRGGGWGGRWIGETDITVSREVGAVAELCAATR